MARATAGNRTAAGSPRSARAPDERRGTSSFSSAWLWCARPASNRHGIAYEAMALPIELQAHDWSARKDLNLRSRAPEARAFAGLSYWLEMAPRREIGSLSARRQRARLTRCVTGPLCHPIGGQLVRSAGLEPAWLPATLSRWCVYRFRHERRNWRTRWDSNPRSFRAGLRDRALCRSGHWSGYGGPGWFRATCGRVKRPLPLHSGLTLRVRSQDRSRRQAAPVYKDSTCFSLQFCKRGVPVKNRTSVSALSARGSATELRAHWYSLQDSNLGNVGL